MKMLCSLALAGLASFVTSPSESRLVDPAEVRTPAPADAYQVQKERKGVNAALCMIWSDSRAIAKIRFEYRGEGKDAVVTTPVMLQMRDGTSDHRWDIISDGTTVTPDQAGFGFVLRVPQIEGRGSLTVHHLSDAPAFADVVDLSLPTLGVKILATGTPESPANTPRDARADCAVFQNAPAR